MPGPPGARKKRSIETPDRSFSDEARKYHSVPSIGEALKPKGGRRRATPVRQDGKPRPKPGGLRSAAEAAPDKVRRGMAAIEDRRGANNRRPPDAKSRRRVPDIAGSRQEYEARQREAAQPLTNPSRSDRGENPPGQARRKNRDREEVEKLAKRRRRGTRVLRKRHLKAG